MASPLDEKNTKNKKRVRKEKTDRLSYEKRSAEDKSLKLKKISKKLKLLKLDNESILARQQEAEKKLAISAPEAQQCEAYLKNLQQNFYNITEILKIMKAENPTMEEKLRSLLKEILNKLSLQF